jgi:hypothetical protein
VKAASHNETLNYSDMLGANLRPSKQPVFSTHRNHAERSLKMIGIELQVAIAQKYS